MLCYGTLGDAVQAFLYYIFLPRINNFVSSSWCGRIVVCVISTRHWMPFRDSTPYYAVKFIKYCIKPNAGMVVVCAAPLVTGPSSEFFQFINKCGLISPVMLQMQSIDVDAIIATIKASKHVCMLQKIPIDLDVGVTPMLDAGLSNALFTAPQETSELEILKNVLASFPANRVGVSISTPVSLQSLNESLALYATLCCSLAFQ